MRLMRNLAIVAAAGCAASAYAQPTLVNLSGATLLENFLSRPASTNDWLDCDGDAILLCVEQVGGIACHTGRARCFYRRLEAGAWMETEPVLRDPSDIYGRHTDRGASHD